MSDTPESEQQNPSKIKSLLYIVERCAFETFKGFTYGYGIEAIFPTTDLPEYLGSRSVHYGLLAAGGASTGFVIDKKLRGRSTGWAVTHNMLFGAGLFTGQLVAYHTRPHR